MKNYSTINCIRTFLLLSTILLSTNINAGRDLSTDFKHIYAQQLEFTSQEQKRLNEYDIIFIPGILAETLISTDHDSSIDISIFTKDYFATQLEFLIEKYGLNAKRIKTSSRDVSITRENIRNAVLLADSQGKKVILLAHSLGGVALLEELIKNPAIQNKISGIIFLQSPFHGTPVGDILLKSPYLIKKLITKALPFVNISNETLGYLEFEFRENFLKQNKEAINKLIKKIPIYTFSGVAEGNKSLFKPLIDIMETGCLKGLQSSCITEKAYSGPYDQNDGLIPLKSTFLEDADYVILEKCDHAEIILRFPFEDYSKEYLTTSWLRLLMKKMN